MGIWSEIKYALNSTLGTSEFKSLDKIVEDKVNTAIANRSVIRHIQRGTTSFGKKTATITLTGFSDAGKMIVLLDGGGKGYYNSGSNYHGWNIDGYVYDLTTTSLTIYRSYSGENSSDGNLSYQVIEFW